MANADVFKSLMGKGKGKGEMAPAPGSQPTASDISPWTGTEQPVTVQPVLEPEPMSEAPATAMPQIPKPGFYRGKGGYEYIVGKQGDITIAKSPRGKAGTVVNMDSVFYDAIAGELAGQTGSAIPTTVSERMKGAAMPSGKVTPVTGEMEAVAYADKGDELLGPVSEAGKYGSGAARMAQETGFETAIPSRLAAQRTVETEIARTNAEKRDAEMSELRKYAKSGPGIATGVNANPARARLIGDATAGLVAMGLSTDMAKAAAENVAKGIDAGMYSSLEQLKALAALKSGGATARPAQVAAR